MNLTIDHLRRRFALFNGLYFGGRLPEPEFGLSRARTLLGRFSCRYERRSLFGRRRATDFAIRVSTFYELTERDCDNILLHEMIHLYIAAGGLRDTSPHGSLFRREMQRLNAAGWSIGVTTNTRSMPVAERSARKPRIVLVMSLDDGRWLVSVVGRGSMRRLDALARRVPAVTGHAWYVSADPYFARFPMARSLRGRAVTAAEMERLKGMMVPVENKTNKTNNRK